MSGANLIIPLYKHKLNILRAIDVCLIGNNLNLEVIDIDDGSTDSTQQVENHHFYHF